MNFKEVEALLQTYDLTEIFEWNEKTEEEVLYFLINSEFIKIPDPRPVDL